MKIAASYYIERKINGVVGVFLWVGPHCANHLAQLLFISRGLDEVCYCEGRVEVLLKSSEVDDSLGNRNCEISFNTCGLRWRDGMHRIDLYLVVVEE